MRSGGGVIVIQTREVALPLPRRKKSSIFQDKVGGCILVKCWLSINTVSPVTAYQWRLVIRICVERGGDTTIKALGIASCESCPSRRRRCYIIPGMLHRQCATSQDTSENSTT